MVFWHVESNNLPILSFYLSTNINSMKAKEYSNGEVTVVWKSELCTHSGNCVRGLPEVFQPKERPWIKTEAASTEALVEQVKQCPSGALSFYFNDATDEPEDHDQGDEMNVAVVSLNENGPMKLTGPCEIQMVDGSKVSHDKDVFLCRCGASQNKPYCDGAHRKSGFEG